MKTSQKNYSLSKRLFSFLSYKFIINFIFYITGVQRRFASIVRSMGTICDKELSPT